MPKEDRRIIFSRDEVYNALYTMHDQKQIQKLPVGQIITAGMSPENEDKIFFVLENQAEQTHAKVEHDLGFVAAALMLFCKGSGIPLPKSAKKSVMLQEGTVILRVQM